MSIEIEKKFTLTEENKKSLIEGAELVNEKSFTDIYYDNRAYGLTTKDNWLRQRDGKWELKVALTDFMSRVADQYKEIEDEAEIADHLGLLKEIGLAESLANAGYFPFATITTTRAKYRKEGFTIDLDSIDFGYKLAEIEKMVADQSEMNEAVEQILDFARRHNLTIAQTGQTRGKVIEYLIRKDRDHFEALVKAGVALPE